jgi:hypothetical protein
VWSQRESWIASRFNRHDDAQVADSWAVTLDEPNSHFAHAAIPSVSFFERLNADVILGREDQWGIGSAVRGRHVNKLRLHHHR